MIKRIAIRLYEGINSIDKKYVLFGTASYLILVLMCLRESGWQIALLSSAVSVLFFISVIAVNYSIIFPRYAKKDSMVLYILSLTVLCLLLTPIKSLFSYVTLKIQDPTVSILSANYKEIFLSLLLVGILSSIVKVVMDWMTQQGKLVELQSKTTSSELKFLKSQINPHFLFNTLNNLYALTLKKSDHAPEVVLKLSHMMRYMLYECNEKKVPLEKEINYIKNYIELETLRQNEDVDIRISVNGDPQNLEITPLLFVPFVENAFKHGLRNNIKEGYMHLQFNIQDNHLEMRLKNSKPNLMNRTNSKKIGGIGLENVRRRLEIIYHEAHHIEIENSPNFYKTTLKIILN